MVLRRNSSDLLPPGERLAHLLLEVFDEYRAEFKELTRQARVWFEARAWLAHQQGTADRFDLYAKWVHSGLDQARILLGTSLKAEHVWRVAKATFSRLIAYRNDEDLAETFFNSVARANLLIVGVQPDIEFASFDNELLPSGEEMPIYRSFHRTHSTEAVVSEILSAYPFDAPYEDLSRDARLAAQAIDMHVERSWTYGDFDVVELAEPVFFRNKGAYLVGRLRRANR
ncbi:MAG: isocitrate dehydrogenase kinase/phosphatase AceK regulatory subunit, partial [Myxococcota bacterium]